MGGIDRRTFSSETTDRRPFFGGGGNIHLFPFKDSREFMTTASSSVRLSPKPFSCFLCIWPHRVVEYLNKKTLNALKTFHSKSSSPVEKEKGQD